MKRIIVSGLVIAKLCLYDIACADPLKEISGPSNHEYVGAFELIESWMHKSVSGELPVKFEDVVINNIRVESRLDKSGGVVPTIYFLVPDLFGESEFVLLDKLPDFDEILEKKSLMEVEEALRIPVKEVGEMRPSADKETLVFHGHFFNFAIIDENLDLYLYRMSVNFREFENGKAEMVFLSLVGGKMVRSKDVGNS